MYICIYMLIFPFVSLAAQHKLSDVEAKAKGLERDALQLQDRNTELEISSKCKDDELKVHLCVYTA